MGGFGLTAIEAVKIFQSGVTDQPKKAWDLAASKIINSESGRNKGCPRGTFLGLCEQGKVKGIPPGIYTKSKSNKEYALKALDLLRVEPALSAKPTELWRRVGKCSHNQQMDVVTSLWNDSLILHEK